MIRTNIVLLSIIFFLVMAFRFIFFEYNNVYFYELNIIDKIIIILGILGGINFWLMMLIDFFNNTDLNNRVIWGLGLIFFSWIGAICYYLKVYNRKNEGN